MAKEIDTQKRRAEGLKKEKAEAYREGRRIANDGDKLGFGRATSKMFVYDGDVRKEIDRGYADRKKEIDIEKELDKRIKKSGNRKIKKMKAGGIGDRQYLKGR